MMHNRMSGDAESNGRQTTRFPLFDILDNNNRIIGHLLGSHHDLKKQYMENLDPRILERFERATHFFIELISKADLDSVSRWISQPSSDDEVNKIKHSIGPEWFFVLNAMKTNKPIGNLETNDVRIQWQKKLADAFIESKSKQHEVIALVQCYGHLSEVFKDIQETLLNHASNIVEENHDPKSILSHEKPMLIKLLNLIETCWVLNARIKEMFQDELMAYPNIDVEDVANSLKRMLNKVSTELLPVLLHLLIKCSYQEIKDLIDTHLRVRDVLNNISKEKVLEKVVQHYINDPIVTFDHFPNNTIVNDFFINEDNDILNHSDECRDHVMAESIHLDLLTAVNSEEKHLAFYAVGVRHLLSNSRANIVDQLREKGWIIKRVNYNKVEDTVLPVSSWSHHFFNATVSIDSVSDLQMKARNAYNDENYKTAETFYLKLINVTAEPSIKVQLYELLSVCYIQQAKFSNAIQIAEISIAIQKEELKQSDCSHTLKIITGAKTLASAHDVAKNALSVFKKNEFKMAAELFEKAIAKHSTVLSRSMVLATYHYNCASAYDRLGKDYLRFALPHLEIAYQLNLDSFGKEDKETQSILKKLISLKEKKSEFASESNLRYKLN